MIPITKCRVEIVPLKGEKDAVLKESPAGSAKYEIVVRPKQFHSFIEKIGSQVFEGKILKTAGVCEYAYSNQKLKAVKVNEGYDPVQDGLDKKFYQTFK